jgi:SWI/SNF related-matrix-associated actin-dependent regulator of chromatin subfamily C
VDPDTRPATLGPPFTGHFRVILDTPRGLSALHPGTKPPTSAGPNGTALKSQPSTATPNRPSLELRSNIYQTSNKASTPLTEAEALKLNGSVPAKTIAYQCDTCGVDCTKERYHCLRKKDFEICPNCYFDGRFPSSMYSGDFLKITAATQAFDDDEWTDQEVLLLLEGLEMYDDDWGQIEAHVKTRTAHQCIKKFLDLPIEDPYLHAENQGINGAFRHSRLPFEQGDNPIMSVVAFLAGVAKDGPVADAAKTALAELAKEEAEARCGTVEPKLEDKDDEPASEAMPIDQPEKSSPPVSEGGTGSHSAPNGREKSSDEVSKELQAKKHNLPESRIGRAADLAFKSISRAATNLASEEENNIRSTLSSLVKLTLTKLDMKMSQFEELEELVEEERIRLETAKKALVSERLALKKLRDEVGAEMVRGQEAAAFALASAPQAMGTSGQGPTVREVESVGDMGPVEGGAMHTMA